MIGREGLPFEFFFFFFTKALQAVRCVRWINAKKDGGSSCVLWDSDSISCLFRSFPLGFLLLQGLVLLFMRFMSFFALLYFYGWLFDTYNDRNDYLFCG